MRNSTLHWLTLVAAAVALAGCGDADAPSSAAGGTDRIVFGDYKGDDLRVTGGVRSSALGQADGPGTILEVAVTDVWGRLPDVPSKATLRLGDDGPAVALEGFLQPILLRLEKPGVYHLEAEIPDHHPERLSFSVSADGTVPVSAGQVRHYNLSRDTRKLGDAQESVFAIYVGLEHRDFAASGPAPRKGTQVELYDNGRDAFGSLAADLETVRERAHFAYWLIRGDFELTRDPDWANVSLAERRANSFLGRLDSLPGTRRVILNQFWGNSPFTNESLVLDGDLVARARAANDDIEVILQGNETEVPYYDEIELRDDEWSYLDRLLSVNPDFGARDFLHEEDIQPAKYDRTIKWTDLQAASWHQKLTILDGRVAYVGGMNMNSADWDEPDLAIYNPLRMPIDATPRQRQQVVDGKKRPATAPRRDYMLRVTGRVVDDIEAEFQKRWDLALMEGHPHAERATPFHRQVPPDPRGQVEGLEVQLTVTNPMPFWEHSVLESMRRMIEGAEQLIFIEDQYFRAPLLNEIIMRRMDAVPTLKLVVVTKPVAYLDPGRKWTAITGNELLGAYPDRVAFYQLKANDIRPDGSNMVSAFSDVDVHSKMLIVDDRLMSVGSANKNNRGLIYEGEANLVIRDRAWVGAQRRRIFASLVGDIVPESELADPDLAFEILRGLAETNRKAEDLWLQQRGKIPARNFYDGLRPQGLVFPLEIPSRWWFDVGPDFA